MGETPEAIKKSFIRTGFNWEALVSIVVFAGALEALAQFVFPPYLMPSITVIVPQMLSLNPVDVYMTLGRVVLALVVSFFGGLAFAIYMYFSRTAERFLIPLVRVLMAVPATAYVVIALIWFSNVELRIFSVLVVTCMPIFIVSMLDGFKTIHKEWREMVIVFRPSSMQLLSKLIIPAGMPSIITSWRITLSIALRVATIAELVGATVGLGYLLSYSQQLFSMAEALAVTIILVIILGVSDIGLYFVEKRAFQWRG